MQAERGVWKGETISQIQAFYWLGLRTPSGPLLMEPDDLLDTLAYSVHHLEAGPCVVLVPITTIPSPNPLASPLGGDWGQTPWAHPLVLHGSRHHALLLLLFIYFLIHVIGWSGGCFNPGFIPRVSLWLLICNTPLGNEPLLDWHSESTSRLWLYT